MIVAVADTHAVIWYLWDDPRLSTTARAFIEATAQAGQLVAVSSISLIETVYLIEKGRVDPATLSMVLDAFDTDGIFVEQPVDRAIVPSLAAISRLHVPDMPDRIIAATATFLGVPLITRDRQIQSSSVTTLW